MQWNQCHIVISFSFLTVSFFLSVALRKCSMFLNYRIMQVVSTLQHNAGSISSPLYKFPPLGFVRVQILETREVIHSLYWFSLWPCIRCLKQQNISSFLLSLIDSIKLSVCSGKSLCVVVKNIHKGLKKEIIFLSVANVSEKWSSIVGKHKDTLRNAVLYFRNVYDTLYLKSTLRCPTFVLKYDAQIKKSETSKCVFMEIWILGCSNINGTL